MQHTDALLPSHFPNVKRISAEKDFTLNDNGLKQLPKYALEYFYYPGTVGGGGGYFGCTIDGDHQMGGENKETQKNPRASNKTPQNCWTIT